jgi:putative transcriptional regulator
LNELPDYVFEVISRRIAGDIILSSEPGRAIRKWREIYGLSQFEAARLMGVKPSVLSDYERGRRSAGRHFIKRFIETLFMYDSRNDWSVTKRIARLLNIYVEGVLDIGEFVEPVSLDELLIISEGVLLSASTIHRPVKGYTVLDSVRAVEALTANEYVKAMGATSDRVVVFTNITRGRSVMVATRVSPVKPSVIILHGIKKIDPLAVKIAVLENMPLIQSLLDVRELIRRFRRKTLL